VCLKGTLLRKEDTFVGFEYNLILPIAKPFQTWFIYRKFGNYISLNEV
jgi:hypothetical protein